MKVKNKRKVKKFKKVLDFFKKVWYNIYMGVIVEDTLFKYGRCVGKIYKPHVLTHIHDIYSCRGKLLWYEVSQVILDTYAELAEERDKNGKTNNY